MIPDLQSLRLPAGTRLRGVSACAELRFKEGQPGLLLSAGHELAALRLATDETQIAVGMADDAEDLGTIAISDLTTTGRVHLAASCARQGHLSLSNIHVLQADARLATHRPAGFGGEVLLGGLSVHNVLEDSTSHWTPEARNLPGGSKDRRLRGSGIYVFGGSFIPVDADARTAPAPTQEGGTTPCLQSQARARRSRRYG